MRRLVNAVHADMARLGMHSDPAYEALADSIVNASDRLADVYQAKTAGGK